MTVSSHNLGVSTRRHIAPKGSRVFVLTATALLVSLLSSCALLEMPTADDVTGSWIHDDGTTVSSLTVYGDGTFEATDIPVSVLDGKWRLKDDSPQVSFRGEWEWSDGHLSVKLPPESNSHFDAITIDIQGISPDWGLRMSSVDDPDGPDCYLFLRSESKPTQSEFLDCFVRG